MGLLKDNLPIFALLNLPIGLFIYVCRHDCEMNRAVNYLTGLVYRSFIMYFIQLVRTL